VDAKERTLDRWIHWCHTDLFSVNKLVSGEDFPKKTNPLNVSMYMYIYIYVSIYICMLHIVITYIGYMDELFGSLGQEMDLRVIFAG
jgi:hypothetical protein